MDVMRDVMMDAFDLGFRISAPAMNGFMFWFVTLSKTFLDSSGKPKLPASATPLRFDKNGSFHISVFSDFHLGMYPHQQRGQKQDISSVRVMNTIVDREHPDLVVLNGDLINGDSVFLHNGVLNIDKILLPLSARNLTWASTHGNHDHQPNLSSRLLLARERAYHGARTDSMVRDSKAGTTNYYLPVYGPDCVDSPYGIGCTPRLILWFFDSRGGYSYRSAGIFYGPTPQPNWVHNSVVAWFNHTRDHLNRRHGRDGHAIPSLAFVHIPVYASRQLQQYEGLDPHHHPGINGEPVSPQSAGWCSDLHHSKCVYGGHDSAFMSALAATPGLIALFSGHDHANSWCHRWSGKLPGVKAVGRGLSLCYGQRTGYGGYGNMIRGSREISVSLDRLENLEVDTYIHTERHQIVGAVSLNATYGKDVYPATREEKSYLP